MEQFRDFEVRLKEFAETHDYTIVADEGDYIIFDDANGKRIYSSSSALHYTMISEGIL